MDKVRTFTDKICVRICCFTYKMPHVRLTQRKYIRYTSAPFSQPKQQLLDPICKYTFFQQFTLIECKSKNNLKCNVKFRTSLFICLAISLFLLDEISPSSICPPHIFIEVKLRYFFTLMKISR